VERETSGNPTHHRLELTPMAMQNIIVWSAKPMAAQLIIVWS
jgi:hypothetical protein